jgi:hypothetical protein
LLWCYGEKFIELKTLEENSKLLEKEYNEERKKNFEVIITKENSPYCPKIVGSA